MQTRTPVYLALFLLSVAVLYGLGHRESSPIMHTERSTFAASDFLSGEHSDEFARVSGGHEFNFPEDHGPHQAYRSEWWYFTGNLSDTQGHDFGYQLTFFRFSPGAKKDTQKSAWRSNQLYMAHFALSDVSNEHFHAFERFSRAALGLSGAKDGRLEVWLDDWSASANKNSDFPIHLKARQDNVRIELTLEQGKPEILHGENGVSTKNSEPGNASYYYSYTRMPSLGKIWVDGKEFSVSGDSWMDREWSSSALGKDQLGWDWFALQLSNNYELMFYRLRRQDGLPDEYSYGALIKPDGELITLSHEKLQLQVLNNWKSRKSQKRYPAAWQLSIPDYRLDLQIVPRFHEQEINLSFSYWEGAVKVEGSFAKEKLRGSGYVELTGY